MKKILILLIISLLYISNTNGQQVRKEEARKAARNVLSGNTREKSALQVKNIEEIKHEDTTVYYIIRTRENGAAIISADKKAKPVLAYSEENSFTGEITHPGLKDLLDFYKTSIYTIISKEKKASDASVKQWNEILSPSYEKTTQKSVSPLLNVNWDQGAGWNKYCPEDDEGPGGHVYAGCVAVSMAQAMSVYQHPQRGESSKSYVSAYGYLSVNFGNTEYNWDYMSKKEPDDNNALLLYHCGVAVEMDYDNSGSGSYTEKVPGALEKYFDYSTDAKYQGKTDEEEYIKLLQNELDNGRPIVYSGSNSESGHAFNLDGYQDKQFHINWGWNGQYNGYYSLSNLNPGTYSFTYGQGAVIGIKPFDHTPQDILLSNNIMLQEQPEGTIIGEIDVIDNDKNENHQIEVLTNSGAQSKDFSISKDSLLVTDAVISYDASNPYRKIIIEVEDKQGNTLKKSFKIYVKETNHAPSGIVLSDSLIDSGTKYYQELAHFSAKDEDTIDKHTYSFVNDGTEKSKDNSLFFIEDSTLIAGASFNNINKKQLHILVKASDGFDEIVKSFVLTNEYLATRIEEQTASNIRVYPNPFHDLITITDIPSEKTSILVYNLQGSLITQMDLNHSNHAQINLSKLTPGTYIIQLINEQGTVARKTIIKR